MVLCGTLCLALAACSETRRPPSSSGKQGSRDAGPTDLETGLRDAGDLSVRDSGEESDAGGERSDAGREESDAGGEVDTGAPRADALPGRDVRLDASESGEGGLTGPRCPEEADCTGRVCGPDPVCGTSCGECTTDLCSESGQCVQCRDHADCGSSAYFCDSTHACRSLAEAGYCRKGTGANCPAQTRCSVTTLRCEPCPGPCERDVGERCYTRDDCDPLVVNISGACSLSSGTCTRGSCRFVCSPSGECVFTSACEGGLACKNIDTNGTGQCLPAEGDQCTDSSFCAGLVCEANVCRMLPACTTRNDCPRPPSGLPNIYECVDRQCVAFHDLRCETDADCGNVPGRRCIVEIGWCAYAP
ncbi:MAG: hypothetical protein IT384_04725 [Deltaproteobacteria bacterium]|nr:hypothetical protein [Deltaproteobacteria bacterium]